MSTHPQGIRLTWIGLWLNILLGVLKCGVGLWVNSKALIADGLHSLTDLATDLATLVGVKIASKPQDAGHPYGHHKYTSLSILFISVMLLVFCLGLIYSSVLVLIQGASVDPEWPALLAAVISLTLKEWLYWKTRRAARDEGSRLIMANALHHRTDSISSLIVLVALVVVLVGGEDWAFLDKAVGLILAVWLGGEGVKMLRGACNDLLDAAPEKEIINDLREHILPVPGALAYHQFRVRRVGDVLEADLHLQVDPNLTVEQGHEIAKQVKAVIQNKHPEVLEVLIHLEPASRGHIKSEGIHDGRRI